MKSQLESPFQRDRRNDRIHCVMSRRISQKTVRFIGLFAGCGGLSEGFIRTDYAPVAHMETNEAACRMMKMHGACYRIECADGLKG